MSKDQSGRRYANGPVGRYMSWWTKGLETLDRSTGVAKRRARRY
ncbi:uncharacterized protein METZ01_LOCUS16975 [marine metagenome]|uniref:Uncharacterized protein n=1 Tax=marine metagenome TaxID=408172 RepID=A0A381PAW9_9ZZZZ